MMTIAVVVALGGAGSIGVQRAAAASPYAFNKPHAIAVNGGHLWIANYGGNSVTETTSSGTRIRTLSGVSYGFNGPDAVVSHLGDVFVVNHGGSVTELNGSTGALVRVIRGPGYDFVSPNAAVVQGSDDVWVVDTGNNAVTEFSATTGVLIRVLTNAKGRYGFAVPTAIAVAGPDLWVTSKAGGSATDPNAGTLTEIDASTGALVRRVSNASDALEKPSGIAFDGTHLWISDAAINAVTELTPTGALTRVVRNNSLDQEYGFASPTLVVGSSPDIYVISPGSSSPMVTQITASTAEGNWYECNTNTPDPKFNDPTGLVVYTGHVWVVSPGDNTLTELSLALGGNRVNIFT
jgi:hypothetical protein